MLIPVRCMTCGKTLADKYDYYVREVAKLEANANAKSQSQPKSEDPGLRHFDPIRTGPILDKLGLVRVCCRRDMIATVDMMEQI